MSSLDADKATDLIAIPLAGKSSIADYMVIASGSSSRQLVSMAEHLNKAIKAHNKNNSIKNNIGGGAEGAAQGDWILIDAGDVIIHLFRPEVRAFYQLEKMWLDHETGQGRTTTAP